MILVQGIAALTSCLQKYWEFSYFISQMYICSHDSYLKLNISLKLKTLIFLPNFCKNDWIYVCFSLSLCLSVCLSEWMCVCISTSYVSLYPCRCTCTYMSSYILLGHQFGTSCYTFNSVSVPNIKTLLVPGHIVKKGKADIYLVMNTYLLFCQTIKLYSLSFFSEYFKEHFALRYMLTECQMLGSSFCWSGCIFQNCMIFFPTCNCCLPILVFIRAFYLPKIDLCWLANICIIPAYSWSYRVWCKYFIMQIASFLGVTSYL